MHETSCIEKRLRAAVALALAIACGAVSSGTSIGSETHFLARCSVECGAGLECIDGSCTRACTSDGECSALNAASSCEPAESASGIAACRVSCSSDGECGSYRESWSCEQSRCVAPPASLSVPPAGSSGRCPTFAGGVAEPIDVEATYERVPGSANVEWAYADEGGVYWVDFDGGIYGVPKGTTRAITFRAAPSPPVSHLGVMGDESRLYWGEASAYPSGPLEPGPPPPPGRLMAVAKNGGAPELLVESPSFALRPVGVDPSGRLFVMDSEGYVNEVTSSGALERMTNVGQTDGGLQLVDGLLYWSRYDDRAQQTVLLVAAPGGAAPLSVTLLPPESTGIVPFVAGRGIVLWTTGETRFDPLRLVQHFVMFNQNTGCVQELPSVELSIGQTLLDARHVYWQSFNALGALSPGQPEPAAPILRVDLRTGRFEHLVTPGLESTVGTALIAQDETTLYLRQSPDQGLFAVRKPD